LVRGAAGNLYGTTHYDGADGEGTVFKLTDKGVETVLYSFTGGADGARPFGGLVRDAAGNLYGTAWKGGASSYGTVFEVSNKGVETVLYSFGGGTTDGCYPYGGLLMDAKGILYGTTAECGTSSYGTVFKLSKDGKGYKVLHNFAGGSTDGAYPLYTSLIMDAKGVLYGNTYNGGATNQGVVYKLTKSGTSTLLWSFAGGATDGCLPYGTPWYHRLVRCLQLRNRVEDDEEGHRDCAAQLRWWVVGRAISLSRCDSGREGKPIWRYRIGRDFRPGNGV
jgi:uncharacterized repeat protein (TIGR03803 family)